MASTSKHDPGLNELIIPPTFSPCPGCGGPALPSVLYCVLLACCLLHGLPLADDTEDLRRAIQLSYRKRLAAEDSSDSALGDTSCVEDVDFDVEKPIWVLPTMAGVAWEGEWEVRWMEWQVLLGREGGKWDEWNDRCGLGETVWSGKGDKWNGRCG